VLLVNVLTVLTNANDIPYLFIAWRRMINTSEIHRINRKLDRKLKNSLTKSSRRIWRKLWGFLRSNIWRNPQIRGRRNFEVKGQEDRRSLILMFELF